MPELTVVVPTITGREESLQRTLDSYEATLEGVDSEIVVIQDAPTWPDACNLGFKKAEGDVIHFTADDLEALPGWWDHASKALQERPNELPAPRVYDFLPPPEGRWMNEEDGPDGAIPLFTRIPIFTREQGEKIGPWPAIVYYADYWVSEKARTLGIETHMVHGYDFVHHWCQIGRVDSKENMDLAGMQFNQLVKEMK